MSLVEITATLPRKLAFAWMAGLATTLHLLPFQRSIRVWLPLALK
jgi:hypothetical protein